MTTETFGPKSLAYTRVSNEIARRLQDVQEKQAAAFSAARAAANEAVDALEANARIFGHQKEAVAETLATDHVASIELLRDTANHRSANELGSIGVPAGHEKKASAFTATGAAVADFDETDAGQAFRRALTGT